MTSREVMLLQKRLERAEAAIRRITQVESKPRLVVKPGSTSLYRFTLNASLASGTADADILEMDGTDTTIDADVLDPLGIFASLTAVGSPGLCLLQNGSYYVIQAPCP